MTKQVSVKAWAVAQAAGDVAVAAHEAGWKNGGSDAAYMRGAEAAHAAACEAAIAATVSPGEETIDVEM